MKVNVLKDFSVAVDEYGVKTRALVAQTQDEIADELFSDLEAEGYVQAADDTATVITGTGEGEALPLYIPDDWKTQHWKKRVALAKALGWVDGEPTTEQADGWISDVLVHRAREVPQEALGGLSIREAHDNLTKAGVEWDAGATVEDLAELLAIVEA